MMAPTTAQKSRLPMKSTRYAAAFVLSINSYHLLYLNTMMNSTRKAVMQSMMYEMSTSHVSLRI